MISKIYGYPLSEMLATFQWRKLGTFTRFDQNGLRLKHNHRLANVSQHPFFLSVVYIFSYVKEYSLCLI